MVVKEKIPTKQPNVQKKELVKRSLVKSQSHGMSFSH